MPRLIPAPTIITAVGNKPKQIQEFLGRLNSDDAGISIARMNSPSGWFEPGQRPEFREISLVLRGTLCVAHDAGQTQVHAGQAIVAEPGEWVQYSTPLSGGADYIAICLPAFSTDTVHRDSPCCSGSKSKSH